MLQRKDEGLGGHHRSGAHNHARTYYILLDGFQLRTVADSLLYQIRAESLIAGILAAEAQKWNAGIYQHLADFIHGTVGIAHQQDRGRRLKSRLASGGDAFCCRHSSSVIQCFFHHELQGTTGLSCSRRSHEQEIILCLLGTEDDVVQYIVIVSGQFLRSVSLWNTLAQKKVAFVLWCTDKLVQVADASPRRGITRSVFDGIRQVRLKDVGVLLSIGQVNHDFIAVNLLQYTFI